MSFGSHLDRWRLAGLALALLSSTLPGCQPQPTGGPLHGSVYVDVQKDSGLPAHLLKGFAVPDVPVYAEPAGGGSPSDLAPSDLEGHFAISHLPPGQYRVCWKAAPAIVAGCAPQIVTVGSGVAYSIPIALPTELRPIVGRVAFKDGTPCRFLAPDFGVDLWTDVALVSGGSAVVKVRANSEGGYLLPTQLGGALQVVATCEASKAAAAAAPGGVVNLGLPNSRPRVGGLIATKGGVGVRAPSSGDLVEIRATSSDPDGDTLKFAWRPSAAGAAFTSVNAPSVSWTLPAGGGKEVIYVLVADGRGGYARARADLSTDGRIPFSGRVIDAQSSSPVADASVTVNGETTKTNAGGAFALRVPEDPRSRYVIDADQDGYEPALKVASGELSGVLLRLYPATVATIDPSQDVDVEDKRDDRNRQRARLRIPANSLVDADGNPAAGPLQLELSTYDLLDNYGRWPGDSGALNAQGQDAVLTPLGSIHVEIKDAAGREYNLGSGKTATVGLNVHPAQAGGPLPASVPAWTYDRKSGLWNEDAGTAFKRVGNLYEAEVSHFSELNVDVQKTGPAACVRIHTDGTIPLPYDLRISVPATGSTPAKSVTKPVDSALSAILRLPPTTPGVKLEVIDSDGNVVLTPGGTQLFTTPAGINDHFPPYPYDACGAPGAADVNIGLTTPPPPASGFLTFGGVDNAQSAASYYTAIDPGPTKNTFALCKSANGFGTAGAGEEEDSAAYLNKIDLGLGRFMSVHKKANGDVAYYVSNYGIPPNLGSADFAAAARLCVTNPTPGCNVNDHLIATVAMEFTQTGGSGPRYTKFYVFNAAGDRVTSADLDGNGAKFIPGLCLTCHGGSRSNYNAATDTWAANGDTFAQFLPFDLEAFTFSALDPSVTENGQQASFKTLNRLLRDNTGLSNTAPIRDLVNGFYGGAGLPSASFDKTWVPNNDWRTPAAHTTLYSQVIKRACRTCHIAREGVDWNSYGLLDAYDGTVKTRVCTNRQMPQAQVTFNLFWLSTAPNQPATLANAGLTGWGAPTCP